ncbi:unnamed protein product [Parnassius apollo]|uniref:(apollo) hypothetical protein n=1 Tax=Parnassius apollo TaxID=110799 RepID=A0A8S3YD36_PARAO|nr:unnamed protein product [Parnassius apollo]
METNLQHEDLLIKLRSKLNEEKIKLWEPPYLNADETFSTSLQELAKKYAVDLALDPEQVLNALHELQLHSMDRVKANDEFKETGVATFRVKVITLKEKPKIIKIQKMLNVLGIDLINAVATELGMQGSRLKLISNGQIVKRNLNLQEQNLKNGNQLMALVLDTTPEEVKREDKMYVEMRTTRDDAALLSEYVHDVNDDDDEYIKLEDQSGRTVDLPPEERKALLVGMALHERGRAAIKQKDYSLALILLLEADTHFNECRSSLLQTVDNWGILQLDIAWCYAGLRSVGAASDAAHRLAAAERALSDSYGRDQHRLLAVKGTTANERVLLMRLYLLQGIVAFHQNKRTEAKLLLEKAEEELNALRVDEVAVGRLMELGWSRAQARLGLRGAAGDLDLAHAQLAERAAQRKHTRETERNLRQQRLLGVCDNGSPVIADSVKALVEMGFARNRAILAMRRSNNDVAEAVRLLQDQPDVFGDLSEEASTASSEGSPVEIDKALVAELEELGYNLEEAKAALKLCNNQVDAAAELLLSGNLSGGNLHFDEDAGNPSTSTGEASNNKQKQDREKMKLEREMALNRLSSAIRTDEDDYLDTSLLEEEDYLAEYKSLL